MDRETPGFEVTRKLEKMGHRSSDTAELLFEDCEVGEEALLGGKEGAFGALMEALITGRVSHGVKSAAIAEAAFDAARQYATEREAFGRSLSEVPGDPLQAGRHGHPDRVRQERSPTRRPGSTRPASRA